MQGKFKILIVALILTFSFIMVSNVSGNSEMMGFNISTSDIVREEGKIRYISKEHVNTLERDSKWNTLLKEELIGSLEKVEGQGMYIIIMSKEKINEIRQSVENNGYKIDNSMNRKLTESW